MKYSAPLFLSFVQNLCNNRDAIIEIKNDFVIHLHWLGPKRSVENAVGFKHSPRDLMNVNEWKVIENHV